MSYNSYLKVNQVLKSGEILVSPSGFYYLIMQGNGDLVVFRGNDPKIWTPPLWHSNSADQSHDNRHLIMQGDGNLVIYSGDAPHDRAIWASETQERNASFLKICDDGNLVLYKPNGSGIIWATNKTDPVIHVSVESLTYDTANAKMEDPKVADTEKQVVQNKSEESQQETFGGSFTYTQAYGWSDTIETGVTVTSEIDVEIPFVAEGKVEVSVSVKNSYQRNGQTSVSKVVNWNVQCNVKPHAKVEALTTISTTDISVPFTQHATMKYQMGSKIRGNFSGIYTGSGADYLLQTTYSNPEKVTVVKSEHHQVKAAAA